MAITITFTGNIDNDSLQVGDLAYFVTPVTSGGFFQSTNTPIFIGNITNITNNSIDINNIGTDPGPNDFIMFAKDSRINLSGLVGYYAEVTFKNNSKEKAELYSGASGITPSSK